MNIAVDGDSFFHTGWLARFLGLPREHPAAKVLRPCEIAAFQDGWDMCNDTPANGFPNRLTAFEGMRKVDQAVTYWVDDDNNEVQ